MQSKLSLVRLRSRLPVPVSSYIGVLLINGIFTDKIAFNSYFSMKAIVYQSILIGMNAFHYIGFLMNAFVYRRSLSIQVL
jgi:hypothetical protein